MSTFVTIAIPFYNAAPFLGFAIQSVINQSYQNWELILTDDGSTDNSVEIAKKYLFDSRIRLICDGKNKGLSLRFNEQINLAKGKYFARMDADDIMHPNRIEQQVAYLESHSDVDVLGSSAYSIDTKNIVHGQLMVNPFPSTLQDVFNHKCFIHPSVMGKLTWFKNHLYNARCVRSEDKELWARTINHSKFVNLSTPYLFYRTVGVPQVKKYILVTQGDRLIVKSIFPNRLIMQRWILLFKSHIKPLIYIIVSLLHLQNYLIKRRAYVIDDIGKREAYSALNRAIQSK